jgi:hypothetical protein
MLAGKRVVVAIDNTVPAAYELGNADWNETFQSRRDAVIAVARGASNSRGEAFLARIEPFFPEAWAFAWDNDADREPLLAGLREGAARIARESAALASLCDQLDGERDGKPLARFLRDNLSAFTALDSGEMGTFPISIVPLWGPRAQHRFLRCGRSGDCTPIKFGLIPGAYSVTVIRGND